MVGTSATGKRIRRALAVSSSPISNPLLLSIPTSRTNCVEYALKLLVASLVPTRASNLREAPAVLDRTPLNIGPPTCCPPDEYLDAAATTTPLSTSRARSSIWRDSLREASWLQPRRGTRRGGSRW